MTNESLGSSSASDNCTSGRLFFKALQFSFFNRKLTGTESQKTLFVDLKKQFGTLLKLLRCKIHFY